MVITDTSTSVVELADSDLVGRAAGGDRAAWEGLVQRYTGLLWTTARAFRLGEADSADVVQTCWLRLAEHRRGTTCLRFSCGIFTWKVRRAGTLAAAR